MTMKPVLVTSGEPAGVGPDICLALTRLAIPLVVLGDYDVLADRARLLQQSVRLVQYIPGEDLPVDALAVWHMECPKPVCPGVLNPLHASYVVRMLALAMAQVASGAFSALVTAPVHKANINDAGIAFSGHTGFFAQQGGVRDVVMMLVYEQFRVALMTTHLPLAAVSDAIQQPHILNTIRTVHTGLQQDFGIERPRIWVAGLNPHAGESGYLGREELDTIIPALEILRAEGMDVTGPLPADTLFLPKHHALADVFIAMYHDQGLPVLKYAGFDRAVNITLGLPVVRTSVDHGTALPMAGTGRACAQSICEAVRVAHGMVQCRMASRAFV